MIRVIISNIRLLMTHFRISIISIIMVVAILLGGCIPKKYALYFKTNQINSVNSMEKGYKYLLHAGVNELEVSVNSLYTKLFISYELTQPIQTPLIFYLNGVKVTDEIDIYHPSWVTINGKIHRSVPDSLYIIKPKKIIFTFFVSDEPLRESMQFLINLGEVKSDTSESAMSLGTYVFKAVPNNGSDEAK